MITIQEELVLNASAAEVFEFLADFTNLPAWDPGIERATLTGNNPARYHVVANFMGRSVPMEYERTEYSPEARTATLEGTASTVNARDIIVVRENGESCRLTWRAEFEMRGALRFGEALMKPLFVRLGKKAMNGLKEAIQTGSHRRSQAA